jgi:hypothetical protein
MIVSLVAERPKSRKIKPGMIPFVRFVHVDVNRERINRTARMIERTYVMDRAGI